jgi:hypothetical protein
MRLTLLSLFFILLSGSAGAQHITLRHLMAFHSLDDSAINRELRKEGWRYRGVQHNMLRKPRMYVCQGGNIAGKGIPDAQLFLYDYRRKPLCKVELVYTDVDRFNAIIRDSLWAYGFNADASSPLPDEQDLRITSSATYVNRDAGEPIKALILYFTEKNSPRVSLTIFGAE